MTERSEFTMTDVHVLAALLDQVEKMHKDGVVASTVDYFGATVHINAEAFRRLFTEWTIDKHDYYYAKVKTRIGRVTYFALIRRDDIPNWT